MWQELYRLVYRYLSNLGLGHEDAEDLTQETLVAVYIHMDGVKPGKLKAWVFTVARHKYVDWLRRNKKRIILPASSELEAVDETADLVEEILNRRKKELVPAVLQNMSFSDRTLLTMRYYLQLSYEEIAKALGAKPNTVKVGLYRARQRFKAEYQKIEEEQS